MSDKYTTIEYYGAMKVPLNLPALKKCVGEYYVPEPLAQSFGKYIPDREVEGKCIGARDVSDWSWFDESLPNYKQILAGINITYGQLYTYADP